MNLQPDFSDLNNPDVIANHINSLKVNKNSLLIEALPDALKEITLELNKCLNYPIDFTISSMLYAFSVATGNTLRIKSKYEQSAVIYLVLIGNAGTNKSHPLSFAIEPLLNHDAKSYDEYKHKKEQYDETAKMSFEQRNERGLNEIEKPNWQKFLVNDFTPESLISVHDYNKRGLGVYADELAGWLNNMNRYSKGGEEQFWLTQWSGKQISVDRKTSEPILIEKPHISVCGTMQTNILDELAKNNRNQNGFIERLLFSMPSNLKKEYWNNNHLDKAYKDAYNEILTKAIDLPYNEPQVLRCSKKAESLLFDFQRKLTDFSNAHEQYASICSKLEQYALRLSLINQVMLYACNDSNLKEISEQAVKNAIAQIEYFKEAAIKVNDKIFNSNPIEKLPKNKQDFYEALPDRFLTKEALEIAMKFDIKERAFKNFLSKNINKLFDKIQHGEYAKLL